MGNLWTIAEKVDEVLKLFNEGRSFNEALDIVKELENELTDNNQKQVTD